MKASRASVCLVVALAACSDSEVSERDIAAAEDVIGVAMTAEERALMLADVREQRAAYDALRAFEIPNELAPVMRFDPAFKPAPPADPEWAAVEGIAAPVDDDMMVFLSVAELGALLRAGLITSEKLTRIYLDRIREHDGELNAVITDTAELALAQARRADAEMQQGIDRGPLHGIPYGLKDIAAVPGYPTTWGATPYKEQVIEATATVAKRMEEAGAVLIAKTAVGALAWGDVWFGARTNSPWNIEAGASGSSAGSAAGVAAGYFPVAIGTETWGSIISPSVRNGVIGLRPTFGRVSRYGFMTLSWSMDKVGAICRRAEDCGMVLDAIRGKDAADASTLDAGFEYSPRHSISDLRLGYLAEDFSRDEYPQRERDAVWLDRVRGAGLELHAVALPDLPIDDMGFILATEAAAAFDTLTRSGLDDTLVRQERFAWPNVFRAARFIPAVEYLQANRLRTLLVAGIEEIFNEHSLDVLLAPCFSGDQLLATNLSGHPSLVFPVGVDDEGMPQGLCLVGRPFHEGRLLTAARDLQRIFNEQVRIPPGFE